MLAVVGTLVFTQYWYWFPLSHCLALAFTPTCLIALNAQLKMPKLEFRSNAKPSLYAYPAPLEEKKREEREKVTTAVLSIAARQRRKHKDDKMEVVSILLSLNCNSFYILFLAFENRMKIRMRKKKIKSLKKRKLQMIKNQEKRKTKRMKRRKRLSLISKF